MGWTRETGRGERIRTSGLYVPNVALYQAKLHPDVERRIVANPVTGFACMVPNSVATVLEDAGIVLS